MNYAFILRRPPLKVYIVKQTYEAVVDKTPTISIPSSCLKENVLDKKTSRGNMGRHPRCGMEKHPRKENSLGPGSPKQADIIVGVPYENFVYTQSAKGFSPSDYLARTTNSTTIEKQQTREKTNAQLVGLPLSIPQFSVEVNSFANSTRRIDFENQQRFEKSNVQYSGNPLGVPLENIELNTSLLVAHSHPPSNDI